MVMSSINEISNNFNVLNSDSNYLINSVAENEDFEMNQLNLSALFGPSFRPIEMNQPSFTSSCNLPGFYEDYNFNSNSNGFNSNHNSFNSSSNSFNINGNSCCSETSPHPPHNLSGCYFSTNCFNPNNVAIAFQNSHQNFIPNFAYTAADYPFIPRRLRFSEYYFRNRNGPLQENCPTLLNALGYTNSAGNQSAHFQLQANTGENTNYGFSSSTPFQIKQENFENYSHQDGTISSSTVSGVRVEPQHASNYVEVPNKAGKRLRKNSRTPFTPEQIQRLEQEFERDSFSTNYEGVAGEINITPKQVQVWFQNKRSKLKRFKVRVEGFYK